MVMDNNLNINNDPMVPLTSINYNSNQHREDIGFRREDIGEGAESGAGQVGHTCPRRGLGDPLLVGCGPPATLLRLPFWLP